MPSNSIRRLSDGQLRVCPGLRRLWFIVLVAMSYAGWSDVATAQRFQARLFDQGDGLNNLSITAFAQEADGHLWIATVNGLFRYDGSTFKEFSRSAGLTDPSVYSLMIDRDGTLWAGSHGGLFRFDGHLFEEVRAAGKSLRIGVNSMLASAPGGELIVETSVGMFSVERAAGGDAWKAIGYRQRHPAFPDSQDTDGIAIDGAGRLWFGDSGKLCVFDQATVDRYGVEQGVPEDIYVSIFKARSGQMWARGRKHILTWHPGDVAIREVTSSLPPGAIVTVNRRFAEDNLGRILTPTAKGFATWEDDAWTETTATSAGAIEGATDLFADRENSIWIGTDGAGLLHSLGYGLWKNYSTDEGLAASSTGAVAVDSGGTIWLGNNLGANLLVPGVSRIQPSPLAGEQDASFIQSFAADAQGGMWAAGLLGHIFHISKTPTGRGFVDARFYLDVYIKRLRLDRKGVLWIGTGAGIYTLNCQHKPCAPELFTEGGLAKTAVGELVVAPDDSLWVASRNGLDHIKDGTVGHIVLDRPADTLLSLCLDVDGTLWLSGRAGGVSHVRVTGQSAQTIASYSRPQLTSDLISFLEIDSKGRLWVGTDHGVNVLSAGRVFHLTDEDGLIRDDTASKAFLAQADGSVWIGTGKGVSHLTGTEAVLRRQPFQVVIEDAQYGVKPLADGVKAGWNRGTTAFQFSAITFRNNRKLLYHTQLLGFDASETVTKETMVNYPQLPPGSYQFRVYAEDSGNGVVSAPVEVMFTLDPPWWRTAWAKTLGALLVVGLVAGLWYVLHLALLAQKHRLERMVEQRTEELERQANQDALTGLLNRRALFAALTREMEYAHRHQAELCLAIIDLDHFKRVNDTFGHLAGDEVLREAAIRLTLVSRRSGERGLDIMGRYGGEEFLVIFKGAKSTLGLERCESIRKAICAQPMRFEGEEIPITCSIGLAWVHWPPEPVAKLLAEADRALYTAKHKGRNLVECAGDATLQVTPSRA